ncbi:MAG: IS3 family transposase [Bacteroidales bacterium]|nr:IS3 family transposase [Bacteroidales bacterium]
MMLIGNRLITQKLIFHSNLGIQYAYKEFKNLLSSYKLAERSMSRKRDCWENTAIESFFKTLKVEHVYHLVYRTLKEAELSVFDYIEAWYNVNRLRTIIKTFNRKKGNFKSISSLINCLVYCFRFNVIRINK